jgi:arginyl-tRNA synthetase
MNLEKEIIYAIQQAFQELFGHQATLEELALQPTRKEFEGTFTFVVFPFLKITKLNPEASGAMIGEYLVTNCELVSGFNIVKGFLNISVSETSWLDIFSKIYS